MPYLVQSCITHSHAEIYPGDPDNPVYLNEKDFSAVEIAELLQCKAIRAVQMPKKPAPQSEGAKGEPSPQK